jgi:hypothetical protein
MMVAGRRFRAVRQHAMTDLLDPIGSAFSGLVDSSAVQLTGRLFFLYVVIVWVATAWWAFRDMSHRTTSLPAPFLVAGLFALATPLFFVPVAIVYRALRPSETLAEAGERDLTETALEASATHEACPSCGSPVGEGWRMCPFCRYELLVPCPLCTKPVEMAWSICPWCVSELPWAREPVGVFANSPKGFADPPTEPPVVWPDWSGGSPTDAAPAGSKGGRSEEPAGRSPATRL